MFGDNGRRDAYRVVATQVEETLRKILCFLDAVRSYKVDQSVEACAGLGHRSVLRTWFHLFMWPASAFGRDVTTVFKMCHTFV